MNRDFAEMLSALSAAGADFLIVGAHALAIHGHPRATGDLDIWVRPTAENAERVWSALARFGAPLQGMRSADLRRPDLVFQIGVAPARIDILTGITGVEFDSAWEKRVLHDVAGMTLPFLGREDLVRNKLATGRPQDLADVARLDAPEAS
ncbi:MAG: DUF6036 family nucleotidyltransferase [Acidobacteriota bacterium]